jgi:hypothetical protein
MLQPVRWRALMNPRQRATYWPARADAGRPQNRLATAFSVASATVASYSINKLVDTPDTFGDV